jgi:type VI secretion system protein ImpE
MSAEDKLKEGDLAGALDDLQNQVREKPADANLRVFLFQLLSVIGNWDRALTQLNVAGELDSQTYPMVQAYREALRCEALRARVFAGARQPLVFGKPERWIALALEALRLGANGNFAEAASLRDEAYEDAPETSGKIDGEPFEWIADGDTRIGPFIEAVVNGGYYWVPVHRLSKIEIDEPSDLRDFVWAPASFTWANGGQAYGFIPSRYPGEIEDGDPALLLCRRTEWTEPAENTFFGLGQRVLITDAGEHSLLDIRTLEFATEAEAEAGDDGEPDQPGSDADSDSGSAPA